MQDFGFAVSGGRAATAADARLRALSKHCPWQALAGLHKHWPGSRDTLQLIHLCSRAKQLPAESSDRRFSFYLRVCRNGQVRECLSYKNALPRQHGAPAYACLAQTSSAAQEEALRMACVQEVVDHSFRLRTARRDLLDMLSHQHPRQQAVTIIQFWHVEGRLFVPCAERQH